MAIKVKRKKRSRRSQKAQEQAAAAPLIVQEEGDREILAAALARIVPQPDPENWLPMARGLARQKGMEEYLETYLEENEALVGWEWAALWICHTHIAEHGLVDEAIEMYDLLIKLFPHNYLTELSQGRLFRDFSADYISARSHMRFANALWGEGCEANYQLGILYDLLGMPEYAFAFADRAYEHADQFGETSYKLRARISFNQAVAMWQAARPYGDIKAYLRRALDDWPEYERATKFLQSLPEDDEADPKGRNPMQRFTEDIRKSMQQQPSYTIVEPEVLETDAADDSADDSDED